MYKFTVGASFQPALTGMPPGVLSEHASFARRLGDCVGGHGARAAPRRLMLASVFGEHALIQARSASKGMRVAVRCWTQISESR